MNLHASNRVRAWLVFALLAACPAIAWSAPAGRTTGAAPVRHVFIIVLENEPFQVTFGAHSPAPYLAHELPKRGALLRQYYGIGHDSLDNYIALISGQAPNPATQHDCHAYIEFKPAADRLDANGQLAGEGCVYPRIVTTVANQLSAAGLTWKGYMEDMGNIPSREAARCGHAAIGSDDATRHEQPDDSYADKHNPFVYFHAIIDDAAYCQAHVVPLRELAADLAQIRTTPNYAFITPGLCNDGHNAPCADGRPGGLVSADAFLRHWVPLITASPAFRRDGVLIVTFDEGTEDSACCGEQRLPGGPEPGRHGPGGGRIGAVMLSPFIAPGTVSDVPYNHYSALRSVEDWFGLPHLGYAGTSGLKTFGPDVFTRAPGRPARH